MNDDKNKNGLTPDDQEVWDEHVQDITQTPDIKETEECFADLLDQEEAVKKPEKDGVKTSNKAGKKEHKNQPVKTTSTLTKQEELDHKKNVHKDGKKQPSLEMDKKTQEKLRKGRLPIEGRLDLHGMTQGQAFAAVEDFITRSRAQDKRCLLIITGKGKAKATSDEWLSPSQGVLKTRLPEWLAASPFDQYVLRVLPAAPHHGGSGAYYVYLRRRR